MIIQPELSHLRGEVYIRWTRFGHAYNLYWTSSGYKDLVSEIEISAAIGVEVGYSTIVTIISGKGKNILGKGPVRTGVTAILPRGRNNNPVYANWYSLDGNGENDRNNLDNIIRIS